MDKTRSITILIAEDDPDDRLLIREALTEAHLTNDLRFAHDGEELMDYLHHRAKYIEPGSAPCPGLILLDLNMPRKDGREAIGEIRADPDLRRIPIVVLTTSKTEEDILRSYDLGVSGFIAKPVTFQGMIEIMQVIGQYWFQVVELAPK
jgi:CheY-like chemotaxis protein